MKLPQMAKEDTNCIQSKIPTSSNKSMDKQRKDQKEMLKIFTEVELQAQQTFGSTFWKIPLTGLELFIHSEVK